MAEISKEEQFEEEQMDTPVEETSEEKEEVVSDGADEIEEENTLEEAAESEESDETSEEAAEETAEDSEKKGFFKKKDKKKDKKDELIEELNDKVVRQMAEFENFRKRSEKEKSQMYDMGAKAMIEKILPVLDNFERGLQTVPQELEGNAFVDGMNMIYRQMVTMLEEAGVTAIEAVGSEFNPEYHNAVMHIDDEAFGENEVVEEFQKGYMYRETVVRHSMVKVAN